MVVVVIGSGAAGLAAAIEAAKQTNVILVSKALYSSDAYAWQTTGGCSWKTHCFQAATLDGVEAHFQDSFAAGAFANNSDVLRAMCEGAVNLPQWLARFGVSFEDNLKPYGGCSTSRAFSKLDTLGFDIMTKLRHHVHELVGEGRVELRLGYRALDLILEDDSKQKSIAGVQILNQSTLVIEQIFCRSVVLADGGGATMFGTTSASKDKTCDGIAMALRAGAEVVDMEFVQFHPTGLVSADPAYHGALVEEIVRFEGGILLNRLGARFVDERDTRDKVSRAISQQILAGNGPVVLDVSACKSSFAERYPAMAKRLAFSIAGGDASRLPVIPTAHFLMGGVKIDRRASSSISGLFVAGESAGGVHGANRLGGNGLTEALVFGRIAGQGAASFGLEEPKYKPPVVQTFSYPGDALGSFECEDCLKKLRHTMDALMGPVRSLDGVAKAFEIVSSLMIPKVRSDSTNLMEVLDLTNLLLVAKVMCAAALRRHESRGAHFFSEFPNARVTNVTLSARLEREELVFSPQPVVAVIGYNNTRSYDVAKIRAKAATILGSKLLLVKSHPSQVDFQVADFVFDIDLDAVDARMNVAKVCELAQNAGVALTAILPFSDRGIVLGSHLGTAVGLPCYNPLAAKSGLDKYLFRELENTASRSPCHLMPHYAAITSQDDAQAFLAQHKRMILKPRCEGNKRGCCKVATPLELEQVWSHIEPYLKEGIFAESYIDSFHEYSFDTCGLETEWITEKHVDRTGPFRPEYQQIVPAPLDSNVEFALRTTGREVAHVSGGGPNLAGHHEIFLIRSDASDSVAKCVPVEPNPRPAGQRIWDLAGLAFEDFDPWKCWLLSCAGSTVKLSRPMKQVCFAGIRLFNIRSPILLYIPSEEVIKARFPGVREVTFTRRRGDQVASVIQDNAGFCGYVIATHHLYQALIDLLDAAVAAIIKMCDSPGFSDDPDSPKGVLDRN